MEQYFFSLMTDRRNGVGDKTVKALLFLFSLGYGFAVRLRNRLYDSGELPGVRLSKPVISVGNLTLGGAGKTPLVIRICEIIRELGCRPAVLMRGYKARNNDDGTWTNDEAQMLRSVCGVPVGLGPDRAKSARELLSGEEIDVFVLDDGFQHRRIKRDLDVVVVDAVNPFGNGCLLPRGILREEVQALRRADMCVLTKTDAAGEQAREIAGRVEKLARIPVLQSIHQPVALRSLKNGKQKPLSALSGREVRAFCSIGNPDSFSRTLAALGCRIQCLQSFPDHYWYSRRDLEKLAAAAGREDCSVLVTTEKDAVKISSLLDCFPDGMEIDVVSVKMEFVNGYEKLVDRIRRLLRR